LSVTSVNVQGTVGSGPGVVCSKAANGCSGRVVRKRAIAVKPVARRHSAGDVGRRANAIEPANRADNGAGTRANAIGSASASANPQQQTRKRRPRASAQRQSPPIFRPGHAIGQAATNFSPFPMNSRVGVFAVWPAARRYVAFWTARHVIDLGGGAGGGNV